MAFHACLRLSSGQSLPTPQTAQFESDTAAAAVTD